MYVLKRQDTALTMHSEHWAEPETHTHKRVGTGKGLKGDTQQNFVE
jgi:hypothetical protein